MTCDGCAKDVSGALYKLDGISKVEADYKEKLVRVEGTGTSMTGCDDLPSSCTAHGLLAKRYFGVIYEFDFALAQQGAGAGGGGGV